MTTGASAALPHQIAVLCYLYDDRDCLLLLHRNKKPNAGMYSPVGGKLETTIGESPHQCEAREIKEEVGLDIPTDLLRLNGIVSERAYEGRTHWLIFLYEVTRPLARSEVALMEIDEGRLEWVPVDHVASCPIPYTDREIMWPLIRRHRGGFFTVHIDCAEEPPRWEVYEEGSGFGVQGSGRGGASEH